MGSRAGLVAIVVAGCHHGAGDGPDAGLDLNAPDAMIDARNMCPNTTGVLLDPRVDFATGMNPARIAAADIDGDGVPDVVVATTNGFSLLTSTSPGCMTSFAKAIDFQFGGNIKAIVTGDFNGDGKLDVAVADQLYDRLSVLINITAPGGAPAFVDPAPFTAGVNAIALVTGDFDGDGMLDVATAAPDAISVFINAAAMGAPAAAFHDKLDLPHAGEIYGIATGDFDSDGRLDIAVADTTGSTVSIYLNTTDGGAPSFAAPVMFSTGKSPFAIAVADLDNDRKPDVVTTNIDDNTLSILMNTSDPGAPSFADKIDLPTGMRPYAVALGDIDRSGRRDIVVADEVDGTATIYLATASGFGTRIPVGVLGSPHGVALIDLDGDDVKDVIVSSGDANMISVLLAR